MEFDSDFEESLLSFPGFSYSFQITFGQQKRHRPVGVSYIVVEVCLDLMLPTLLPEPFL